MSLLSQVSKILKAFPIIGPQIKKAREAQLEQEKEEEHWKLQGGGEKRLPGGDERCFDGAAGDEPDQAGAGAEFQRFLLGDLAQVSSRFPAVFGNVQLQVENFTLQIHTKNETDPTRRASWRGRRLRTRSRSWTP